MLHHSDEVVLAHVRERRTCLLTEAAADRLARQAQPITLAAPDRLLAALGRRLVQWGERLQAHSGRPQTTATAVHSSLGG